MSRPPGEDPGSDRIAGAGPAGRAGGAGPSVGGGGGAGTPSRSGQDAAPADREGAGPADDGHVRANRGIWDGQAAAYAVRGRQQWADDQPRWGIWRAPDDEVGMLPDVEGCNVVELGCGTAYVSAWLARRGGQVVGLDNSSAQLATARALQHEFDLPFPLVWGDAEMTPFADGSFDVAISEYGACLWCDPYRWIPEAARILRPRGRLIFLTHSPLLTLCLPERGPEPATTALQRDYFGMSRVAWPDDAPAVEFHLPHGEMVRLLADHGFTVERLHEIRPTLDASTAYSFVTLKWARRWPSEEVWTARRT